MSSGAARKGSAAQFGLIIAIVVFLLDRLSKYVLIEQVDIIHRSPIEVTPTTWVGRSMPPMPRA